MSRFFLSLYNIAAIFILLYTVTPVLDLFDACNESYVYDCFCLLYHPHPYLPDLIRSTLSQKLYILEDRTNKFILALHCEFMYLFFPHIEC